MAEELVVIPRNDRGSEVLSKAAAGLGHLKRMELREASQAMNAAVQLAPRNSHLHFLNALTYHLQAKQGDAQKMDVAIEGYLQALRLDPSNWIAREFLGLAHLDHRNFDEAKVHFSEVSMKASMPADKAAKRSASRVTSSGTRTCKGRSARKATRMLSSIG